jgi:hypothetical protein
MNPRARTFAFLLECAAASCILLRATATVAQAQPAPCISPPSGIVSWWAAEGNVGDWHGQNNGLLAGGASYTAGKVGVAFAFTNGTGYALVPDNPSLNFGASDFTIELWAQFATLGGSRVFIAKDEGPGQTRKWMFWLNNGQLQLFVGDGAAERLLGSGSFDPILNHWHHVAVARNGSVFSFYVDGTLSSTNASIAAIPVVNAPVTLGQAENHYFMGGLEDEVTIYHRALSASEIQAIYIADSAGKCSSPAAPYVVIQPQGQTVFAGANVAISVLASGAGPLVHQWQWNGTKIRVETNSTATNATLLLTNVQMGQSGSYSVVVSNEVSSASSSNAELAVLSPGSCLPPPSEAVSWWAADGDAADATDSNTGVLAGGASYAAGKVGAAFTFTNGTGYVLVPNDPSLDFGAGNFTIELWVQFAALGGSRVLIAKDEGPGQSPKWLFWLNNGQLQFLVGNAASQTILGSGVFNPVLNHWHHVAMTRSGSVFSFYVDGVLSSTDASLTAVPLVNAPLTFGQAESAFFMGGLEDEVMIYRRALSAVEIQAIYIADSAGKCTAPMAPRLITQPKGQTVLAGTDVSLNALAVGSGPLAYQWQWNGTNISGATYSVLTLSNAQPDQSGRYCVVVSNPLASIASSNAMLTVYVPICVQPPASVAGWWAGEGNAADSFGTNHGVFVNGPSFALGQVGEAFDFDGSSQYVDVPDYAVLNTAFGLSIEAWIYPRSLGGEASPIIKKAGEGQAPDNGYALELADSGNVLFGVSLRGGTGWTLASSSPVPLNQWTHVMGVFDGTNLLIYLNGSLASVPAPASGLIAPSDNHLQIGHDPSVPWRYFNGMIDEATVYSTALSADQIQAIYGAATAGKCPPPLAPSIVNQPQSLAAVCGSGASFSVVAAGSVPLSYQWRLNGTNIPVATNPTATNATLVLSNVQAAQAGDYSATVTNPLGSTTSSTALLTILLPPAIILQPVNQAVQVDCLATFAAGATGTGPLTYQWQMAGTNLPGQTDTALTIVRVQLSNFGSYRVVASNAYGAVTSSIAVLSLNHPPIPGATIVERYPNGGLRINVSSVLANATDPDGDALSLIGVTANSVAGGTASLSGSSIYYLPPPGYTNADAFNYSISDGNCGGSAFGTMLVEVRSDNNSASRAMIARMADGSVQVIFDGIPRRTYRVQAVDSLTVPNWQDVATLMADQFGTYVFADQTSTNGSARYYRSVSP